DKTRGSLVARMELRATRSPEEAGRPRSQRLIECRRASQPVKEVGDTAPAEQHGHAGDELRAGGNDTRKIFVSQVSRASEVHFFIDCEVELQPGPPVDRLVRGHGYEVEA